MARTRDPGLLERIARAGMKVFAQRGLSQARMSDVAEETGVSHGTLYNYVESKEALFYLLVDWGMRDEPLELPDELPVEAPDPQTLLDRLEEEIGEGFQLTKLDEALRRDSVSDPGSELKGILEELYDRTAETREPADVIERSALDLPEMFALFFKRVRRSLFDRLNRYIRSRISQGHFRSYPDSMAVARQVVESITFAARHRHRDPDPHPADEGVYREVTVAMLMNSLLADGQQGRWNE